MSAPNTTGGNDPLLRLEWAVGTKTEHQFRGLPSSRHVALTPCHIVQYRINRC